MLPVDFGVNESFWKHLQTCPAALLHMWVATYEHIILRVSYPFRVRYHSRSWS